MTILHPVKSSMLSTVGYNQETETLIVQFQNGDFYRYNGVPEGVFVGVLTNQESQGQAFNALVKNADFPFEKIDAEAAALL